MLQRFCISVRICPTSDTNCNRMAYILTITFTDSIGAIIQMVIQNTTPELSGWTTTPRRFLIVTHTLPVYFPSLQLLYFLWLTYTKSHDNGYTLNHLMYFFSHNSTTEKPEPPKTVHTHASDLLPALYRRTHRLARTPLCSISLPPPRTTYKSHNSAVCRPLLVSTKTKITALQPNTSLIGHTSPSYVPSLFHRKGVES